VTSLEARAFRPRRLGALAVLAVIGGLLFFAPQLGVKWPCPVYTILHVPCPSCGLTRAVRLVAHGDFAAATRMHPLWFVVLPFLTAVVATELFGYLRGEAWGGAGRVRAIRAAGYGTVALLVVVWIARFLGAFGGPCPNG
jgi:Protein of unknown function (DUF2752)